MQVQLSCVRCGNPCPCYLCWFLYGDGLYLVDRDDDAHDENWDGSP